MLFFAMELEIDIPTLIMGGGGWGRIKLGFRVFSLLPIIFVQDCRKSIVKTFTENIVITPFFKIKKGSVREIKGEKFIDMKRVFFKKMQKETGTTYKARRQIPPPPELSFQYT